MNRLRILKSALIGGASVLTLASPASAKVFNIPEGDLVTALGSYMQQAGVEIIYSEDILRGHKSRGARGDYTETAALTQLLKGTGFTTQSMSESAIAIVPAPSAPKPRVEAFRVAAAAASRAPMPAAVETVVVTAQKKTENIQNVPIAVTALSQQELTERQIAGGPDLVKEVPNLTFSKTNFTGYNIEIRGIGTQAISVTTDPAVAVAFNDTPFIRNHFFEQEFFDVQDVEVLRGPQGTLYGRNATAGVVNVKSALPTDQYEGMMSADLGNYNGRRLEAMVNVPLVGDKLDLRIAGEWTKRDGYTTDTSFDTQVDGRDLWSTRVTLGWKPTAHLQTYFIWEHFSEDDDRLRSGKALCTTDSGPSSVNGPDGLVTNIDVSGDAWLSQGCKPGSLYAPSAYGVPNPGVIPFVQAVEYVSELVPTGFNPYGTLSQSPNLRDISSSLLPHYRAKNDTLEFNAIYDLTPSLTLTSQTGYNKDFLYSTEDYNRFATVPNEFAGITDYNIGEDLQFCDPQLGCSTQFLAEDLSQEHAQQFYQEFRLSSNYDGPLNFNIGANYLYYNTVEDYYVFSNFLTMLQEDLNDVFQNPFVPHVPFNGAAANACSPLPATPNFNFNDTILGTGCAYIDPNPLGQINGEGHNYFRSENPYLLNSWAGFGEAYYQPTSDVKFTGGLRFTDDMKNFTNIPSWTLLAGQGLPVEGVEKQQWQELTGRFVADWTPQLDFTDQSLFYGSYSRGYKGGGANPPGVQVFYGSQGVLNSPSNETHPLTFKPEFVDAFELGTKNTLLNGALTLNGDIFYYKYQDYQISEIVDRTAVNSNYNATVEGAELESTWEPLPGLKLNFAGGWEDSAIGKNQYAIDLMDRTAGVPGWMVVRPFITQTSSCILPTSVVEQLLSVHRSLRGGNNSTSAAVAGGLYFDGDWGALRYACFEAYSLGIDPGLGPYGFRTSTGFDPATAPNNGEGFAKNLSGNKLPNMPPFTLSFGSQYSLPVSEDWAATLRADFYWQGNSEARVFNDKPYDSIHGYTNLNLALILADDDGWQIMAYVKNVFDVTAITGDFLNSDDTGLTTNVFLTDPRLFGVRVTKNFGDGASGGDRGWINDHIDDYFTDALDYITDKDGGRPTLWIEFGGQYDQVNTGQDVFAPPFVSVLPANLPSPVPAQKSPSGGYGWNAKVTFEPDGSDWVFQAAVRYGRSLGAVGNVHKSSAPATYKVSTYYGRKQLTHVAHGADFLRSSSDTREQHTILDFTAGKNVGLGTLNGTSLLSGGIRVVEFYSRRNATIEADPNYVFQQSCNSCDTHDIFNSTAQAKRGFHGVGPTISWDASTPLMGSAQDGELDFDWGANGAVLFGRRTVDVSHHTSQCHYSSRGVAPCDSTRYPHNPVYNNATAFRRARTAVVPNLGGFAGISWRYSNAKISFGYRADEFFGAMDGGIDTRRSENVGFFGPYANISIGLGG